MAPLPLLFDLDGTLVDSLRDIGATANHVRAAFGLAAATPGQVRRFVGDGAMKLLERALVDAGPFESLRDEAWKIYQEHHLEQCTHFVEPYPDVRAWLGRWHSEDRPMAVVTNKPTKFAERILQHLELGAFLPVAVCGDTLPERKPRPEPVWEALDRLGVPRHRGMMIGDGLQDLRAGKAAGLRTAAALFGFSEPNALRAEGADEYWLRFGGADPLGR